MVNHTRDPARRQAASPSPVSLRRGVTSENSSPSGDTEVKQAPPPTTAGRQSPEATGPQPQPWAKEPKDLGHPPELDPLVQEFLFGQGFPMVVRMSLTDPQPPNHPLMTTVSGPGGAPARWKPWHGGWSFRRSQLGETS